MTFTIRTFIARDGERFSFLYSPDALGIPLFYPSAYTSREVRVSNTHQTQLVALDAIRRLSEWERDRKMSIEGMLLGGRLLNPYEVDDLASHVRTRRKGSAGEVIGSSKFNVYWGYICSYVGWLTDELLPNRNDADVRKLVDDQAKRMGNKTIKRSGSKARKKQQLLDEKLPEFARECLLSIFEAPLKDLNKPTHHGTRMRNVIMMRILYETGMRRGELLSIKLKNFIESSGGESAYLIIERNHDDECDRRINQPVAKTLGRTVPISAELEAQIIEYRVIYRAQLLFVGHKDNDFLFSVHLSGKSEGQPLTVNGFNSAFAYLRKSNPDLRNLNPHALRHDWNYRFSLRAEKHGLSEKEEADAREELMGWAAGSDTAKIYNLRHRRKKAMEIGRQVARDTERPSK